MHATVEKLDFAAHRVYIIAQFSEHLLHSLPGAWATMETHVTGYPAKRERSSGQEPDATSKRQQYINGLP